MGIARSLILAAVAIAGAMVAAGGRAAEPPPAAADDPLAPLAWLAGSCWIGTFADGVTRDLACYEWMLGGKFLRSRHRVIGGKGPYSGETIFALDPATGRLGFTYYNSLGGIVRGAVEPAPDGVLFPSEKVEQGGQSFELRTTWRRRGADGYAATTEKLVEGEWRPRMTIEFVRSGPASNWDRPD